MSATTSIFLVDDDEDDRELFEDAINELARETELVTFSNALELMEHLEDKNKKFPQAIFIDMNMPIMGGEECVQWLRGNKKFEAVPIAIYSTSFVLETANRMKQIGADLYIQKPSSFALLKSILDRSISALLANHRNIDGDFDFVIKEK